MNGIKVFGPGGLYLVFCAAGAATALFFFWQDHNQTLTRLNEASIAEVTWKQKNVQRRFTDRVLWDRLRTASSVYTGDLIRTAELSEAVVAFAQSPHLVVIHENTLLHIAAPGGEDSGSRGEPDLRIYEGSAELWRENESVMLNAGPGPNAGGIILLSPRSRAKFLSPAETPLPVTFAWESPAGGPAALSLDIAEDRRFTRIRHRRSGAEQQVVPLENGRYYWRLYPEEPEADPGGTAQSAAASAAPAVISGSVEVRYAPAPALISTGQNEGFRFGTERPGIRFQWRTAPGAQSYLVEVSAAAGPFKNVQIQSTGGASCSTVLSGFTPGTYSWRVRPVYTGDFQGQAPYSEARSFRVEAAGELAVPLPLKKAEPLYLEGDETKRYLSWTAESDAASYTFLLSARNNLSDPLIREQVRDNYYVLDTEKTPLGPGAYYWGVYQTGSGRGNSALSPPEPLEVIAGAPPARRSVSEPRRPPPAAPRLSSPRHEFIFTEEALVQNRFIPFGWESVEGASAYELTIWHVGPLSTAAVFKTTVAETAYTLRDLTVLDRGLFRWQVIALDGERRGAPASRSFAVDVGVYEAAETQEGGVMFGSE